MLLLDRLLAALLAALCSGLLAADAPGPAPVVLRLEVKGAITPPVSRYVREGIAAADARRAEAVLIVLDTPGGLLDSTREIVASMLNAASPVIVHVAPRGARATSAGVFLMMASDAAAMAPGTHLGAAHPVGLGGREEKPAQGSKEKGSVMAEKAVSDAAAYIRGLATDKGRNAAWAERAVRESVSLTAAEAVEQRVADLVAAETAELLAKLDGRAVVKRGRTARLALARAAVVDFPMNTLQKILSVIADPNLALLFLMLGIYGLIYEFSSPGVGFGAVVGLVSLILAGYAMSILPVNYAGLLIILIAVVLLVLEFQVVSHGLLTVGGLILLALGSFFLFDTANGFLRVSLEVIGGMTAATGAFFVLVAGKLLATRRLAPAVGVETLVGMTGEAREPLDPRGLIFVNSELWTAEAPARVEKGARVKVLEVRGSVLRVAEIKENLP